MKLVKVLNVHFMSREEAQKAHWKQDGQGIKVVCNCAATFDGWY